MRLYLVDSGWYLKPADLRKAVDAKLALTRHKRWRAGLWRKNLDDIKMRWQSLVAWINPHELPPFEMVLREVETRLRGLGLD